MTRKYTRGISLEKIYERLLEESESNPTVLLIKQDCADAISSCFGYNYNAAYRKADELGREYNLNLCTTKDLRGNHAQRVKDELGITFTNNKREYYSALEFIYRCESNGKDYDLKDWFEKYLIRRKV